MSLKKANKSPSSHRELGRDPMSQDKQKQQAPRGSFGSGPRTVFSLLPCPCPTMAVYGAE